jgi:hypothetical protein
MYPAPPCPVCILSLCVVQGEDSERIGRPLHCAAYSLFTSLPPLSPARALFFLSPVG